MNNYDILPGLTIMDKGKGKMSVSKNLPNYPDFPGNDPYGPNFFYQIYPQENKPTSYICITDFNSQAYSSQWYSFGEMRCIRAHGWTADVEDDLSTTEPR